jgi:hypothetical protein
MRLLACWITAGLVVVCAGRAFAADAPLPSPSALQDMPPLSFAPEPECVSATGRGFVYEPLLIPLAGFLEVSALYGVPYGDVDHLDPGNGFGLRGGFYSTDARYEMMDLRFGLELGVEGSQHTRDAELSPSDVDALHSRFLVGVRFTAGDLQPVHSYLSSGIAFHRLDFDNLPDAHDISGFGAYVSGGIGARIEQLTLTLGADVHQWEGSDDTGGSGEQGLVQIRGAIGIDF